MNELRTLTRMKPAARCLLTTAFAALAAATPALAQPGIPRSSIPADMPAEVKEHVEKLYSPSPRERVGAIRGLEAMGKGAAAAAPFLVSLLGDSERIAPDRVFSGSVGGCAMAALTTIGKPAMVPLIAALKDDERVVRCRAAQILGRIGNRRAVPPLIALLKDRDTDVRSHAMNALYNFKDPRAVKPLTEVLKDDDRNIWHIALWTLQAIEDPTAIDAIVGVLKSPDADLRAKAAGALGRMKATRATDSLIQALEDEDKKVRVTAACSLAEFGNSAAVEPLIAAFEDQQSSGPGSGAVWALAKLKDPRAIEPLINALEEKEKIAPTVAAALRHFGKDPRVVEALLAALKSDDAKVRQAAASTLGSIREVRAVGPLIAVLHDSEPDVRLRAVEALGVITDTRALDPLLAIHGDDPTSNVRRYTSSALDRLGYKKWTDRDGNLVGKAAFEGIVDGTVVFKEPGGNKIRIVFEELSPSDQRRAKVLDARKRGIWEELKTETAKKAAEERANYEKRIAELTNAIRRDPTSIEAYINRAVAWQDTEEYDCEDRAIPDWDKAVQLDRNRAETYLARGMFWFDKCHDTSQAIAAYRKALEINPKLMEARRGLAKAYSQRAFQSIAFENPFGVWDPDSQSALSDCNEALRLDPGCASAYASRAMVWVAVEESDKAIADYTEAFRLNPKLAWTIRYRGGVWWGKGDFDKAVADFTESTRLEPRNEEAYINRGSIWQLKGEYQKARTDYSKAIGIKPRAPKAYNARAWLMATCRDPEFRDGPRAVADAKHAVKQARREQFAYYDTLAAAYAEVGDFKNAVRWQQNAIDLTAKESNSTDDAAIESLRARLELYKSGKPYRE